MSYFVAVTFDLSEARLSPSGTGVYAKITADLDAINFTSFLKGRRQRIVDLPNNTYAAKFDDDVDDSSDIGEFVSLEVKKIFKKYGVNGKYFVFVGRDWHWKVGSF
jgi:hypothetical protein